MNVNAKLRIGLTELPRVTDEEEEEKRKSEEMRSLRWINDDLVLIRNELKGDFSALIFVFFVSGMNEN